MLSLVGNGGGGADDGFLQLDEVTRLRLNADLVTLSACETGRGRLYDAEGVVGLARAFLYAGSRGVVCSLWPVDDAATAGLMADLYGGLTADKPAAEAPRAAKRRMMEGGRPPSFWARSYWSGSEPGRRPLPAPPGGRTPLAGHVRA